MTKESPTASSPAASARMKANRGRDNIHEVHLRRALHARGLRYRLHRRAIPGTTRTIDIAFPGPKVAVFVDGCFWHGCPVHGTQAKTNSDFWRRKIETNKVRDKDTDRRLSELGWAIIRVWEHQDISDAADCISEIVRRRSTT